MDPRISYYNAMLERFGSDDPRALAWRDAQSQLQRFEILCQIGDLSHATILDEGCGLGDLYPFLTARFPGIQYTGIDINEQLIWAAEKKYPGASFTVADFSSHRGSPFDYVLASGTLTFTIPNHREVYRAQIEKMYRIANKGVAFNVLNAAHFEGNERYVTYDKDELYAFCKTLTDNVTVRDDYSREDITFYLYK